MTALAASQNVPHNPLGRNVYDLLATQQVWGGGLAGLTAAGFCIPWDDVATTVFLGIFVDEAIEPTQDVAGVHDAGVTIKNIPIAALIQASVGVEVYCTTDNVLEDCDLNAVATSRAIGRIIRFRSAGVGDIELYSAALWASRYNVAVT